MGAYFADDANSADVPAYGILNVALGAQRRIGGSVIEGFVSIENVFNERYVASVFINGVNGRYYEPGLARSGLVGIRWFGD
jgi:iron complex outermembrane recepter protein